MTEAGKPKKEAKPKATPRGQKPPVKPMREDQSTNPVLWMRDERLLGRAVMEWSRLEASLHGLLWAFLKLSMSDGRILTNKMDVGNVINVVREYSKRYMHDNHGAWFQGRLVTIEECREARNMMVHGLWSTLIPDGVPNVLSMRPKAAPGEIISETFSEERMRALVDVMKLARLNVVQLEKAIWSNREKILRTQPHD